MTVTSPSVRNSVLILNPDTRYEIAIKFEISAGYNQDRGAGEGDQEAWANISPHPLPHSTTGSDDQSEHYPIIIHANYQMIGTLVAYVLFCFEF